jgi:chromosome segregation ATPase
MHVAPGDECAESRRFVRGHGSCSSSGATRQETMVDCAEREKAMSDQVTPERLGILEQKADAHAEAVDARFNAVDVRFDAVDARFDAVDARFDAVDVRFDAVDARFDAMDARFDAMDARFEAVDARFEAVDARFDGVDTRLEELTEQLATGLAEQRAYTDHAFGRLRQDLQEQSARTAAGFDRTDGHLARIERKLDRFIDTQSKTNELIDRRLQRLESPSGPA